MHFKHYLTSGEAAKFLSQQLKQKIKYYDLDNLLRAGAIEPPEKFGGRRLWSHADLQRAAKALKIRRAKRPALTMKRSTVKKGGHNDYS